MLIGVAIQEQFGNVRRDPTGLYKITRTIDDHPTILVRHIGRPDKKSTSAIRRMSLAPYYGKRVVFLVRDPRDTVVSNYFESTKRAKNFHGSITEYIRREQGGVRSIVAYFNLFANARDRFRGFLSTTYEALHADTAGELRRVLTFLGYDDISDDAIARAVEAGSFGSMKSMEASESSDRRRLTPGSSDDPESYKVRKGKVGGYEEYLEADDIAFINKRIDSDLLEFYPYRTDSDLGTK
jgi:hypothetical protein